MKTSSLVLFCLFAICSKCDQFSLHTRTSLCSSLWTIWLLDEWWIMLCLSAWLQFRHQVGYLSFLCFLSDSLNSAGGALPLCFCAFYTVHSFMLFLLVSLWWLLMVTLSYFTFINRFLNYKINHDIIQKPIQFFFFFFLNGFWNVVDDLLLAAHFAVIPQTLLMCNLHPHLHYEGF